MTSVHSDILSRSDASREILDSLTKKNETKLFKMEANITEAQLTTAWTGFGLYVNKNIRAGKATTIPKFGIITFGAPSVKLDGVTNPDQRDLRLRVPVFLINKEFVKGVNIQTAIISGGNIRPYSMKGVISGLPQAKINYTEVGFNAGLEKDLAKICVERVIRELADKAKLGKNVEMDIPHVGKFSLRIPLAAIEFNEFLINDTLDATNKITQEKKTKEEKDKTSLTRFNLNEFMSQSHQRPKIADLKTKIVDNTGQNWLKSNFDIDVHTLDATSPEAIRSWNQSTMNPNQYQALSRAARSETGSIYSRPVSAFSAVSSTSRMSKVNMMSQEKALFIAFQNAKKKIKKWIKENSFLPEDLYVEIVKNIAGTSKNAPTKLNFPEFKKGITKVVGLNLEETEIEGLAKTLDIDNQGFINAEKWVKVFGNGKSYLNYIQDIVSNYNLQAEDVQRRMGLNKNTAPLDFYALKEKLRFLDPSLKDSKAEKIAKELFRGKEKLEVAELLKLLGCEKDNARKEKEWYRKQLLVIKKKAGDGKKLRQHFEKFDDKSQGLIDVPNFKAALTEYNLGMNVDELTIFTRYVEKDTDMMIDYVNFSNTIDKLKSEDELQNLSTTDAFKELEQFNAINDKLQEYLKTSKTSARDLIKKLSPNKSADTNAVSKALNETFAEFVHQLFKDSFIKAKSCRDFAKRVDIDKDGYINETDIETFLVRNAYIKEGERESKHSKSQSQAFINNKLFPKAPLAEERFEIILRDLRNLLARKKISFYDLFNSIDQKQTGFITINDFSAGIDKVMKLSQPIKDGFFAYMDTEKLGIVNYDDFLKVFQRSVADKRVDVTEDSFDWQSTMLARIREYALEKNLSADDAFRILDTDFDGFMSKADLTRFLREILNVPADQATQPRVERLYKLMDIYKRGTVQLTDIKMLLQSSSNRNNLILSGGSNACEKTNFDWRLHARQQIGLVLSRQYQSIEVSFKDIAENNVNMKYTAFKKWIEKNRVLAGFDLTDRLIQKLFADLDPHKKGYLLEADWVNAFAGYNTKNQVLSEVQEAFTMNFSDVTNVYDFFLSQEGKNKKEITSVGFEKAIHSILPKRFGNSEMNYLWRKCANDQKSINFKRFMEVFGNLKYSGVSYTALARTIQSQTFLSLSKPQTVAALFTGKIAERTLQRVTKEEKQRKVFDKLRQILAASNVPLEQFFNKIDSDKSGEVNNLEFINGIKSLNLGLNLQEIEDLLMYCDSNQDGKISFQEFIRKFAPQVVENRLFDRSKGRLRKFKENIYFYMLSPKDAFLKFNEDRTGRLTYEQFTKLLTRLHELAKEELPPFPIIRDLFDFLDIRKDGIIDMTEWMQSFRLIETEVSNNTDTGKKVVELPQKRSSTVDVKRLNKTFYSGDKDKNANASSPLEVSAWECSKDYEKILKIIGKNRKSLVTTFDDMKKRGIAIDARIVKEVIGQLLSTTGLTVTESQWLYMYKFAERDEIIDYKFMLDAFKERLYLLSAHPKTSTANV